MWVLRAGEWIYRVPRRRWVRNWLPGESELLHRLAPVLPVSIPQPEIAAAPLPIQRHRALPGESLDAAGGEASLSPGQRQAVGAELGRFLAVLHAQPVSVSHPFGSQAAIKRRQATAAMEVLGDAVSAKRRAEMEALLAMADRAPEGTPEGLLHGDVNGSNLLIDRSNGRLCGVIDFSLSMAGEPAWDFRFPNLSPSLLGDAMLEGYVAAGGRAPAPERITLLRRLTQDVRQLVRAAREASAANA